MLDTSPKERFLRLADVMERTGLSRSFIYLSISQGTFPPNVNLGPRCVGWLESEIDVWMQDRIGQRSVSA